MLPTILLQRQLPEITYKILNMLIRPVLRHVISLKVDYLLQFPAVRWFKLISPIADYRYAEYSDYWWDAKDWLH